MIFRFSGTRGKKKKKKERKEKKKMSTCLLEVSNFKGTGGGTAAKFRWCARLSAFRNERYPTTSKTERRLKNRTRVWTCSVERKGRKKSVHTSKSHLAKLKLKLQAWTRTRTRKKARARARAKAKEAKEAKEDRGPALSTSVHCSRRLEVKCRQRKAGEKREEKRVRRREEGEFRSCAHSRGTRSSDRWITRVHFLGSIVVSTPFIWRANGPHTVIPTATSWA